MGRTHYLPRGPSNVTIQVVSQNRVALGNQTVLRRKISLKSFCLIGNLGNISIYDTSSVSIQVAFSCA